jgi:hypothetical protein
MVKVRYIVISDAYAAFNELRPFWEKLGRLQQKCRPTSFDYALLGAVRKALDTAAFHFTGEATFYGSKLEPGYRERPDPSRLGREG